jgi:hypothetical protein
MTNDEAINRIRLAINELRRSSGNRRDRTTAEQSIRMLETVVEALQKHPLEDTNHAASGDYDLPGF